MVAPALPDREVRPHAPARPIPRFAPFVVPGVGSTLLRAILVTRGRRHADARRARPDRRRRERLSPAMLAVMRENLQLGKRSPWRVESLAYAVESLVAALLGGRELTEGCHSMPTRHAVVWGDADALVGRPVIEHLRTQRPDWQYAVLPGVGHVPMMEAPERYVAIVRAWLEGRDVTAVEGVTDARFGAD
jgi:pimeloyl-ACP methyl ester carboxylesterase